MTGPLYSAAECEADVAPVREWAAARDLLFEGTWESWAVFSPDRVYRYILGRRWDLDSPWQVWTMLNPSKAGSNENDPTVRKVIGFSKRRRAGGAIIVNLAALVSTDPRGLARHPDPIGPYNHDAMRFAFSVPSIRVAAWGRPPTSAVGKRLISSEVFARHHGSPLHCYGRTKEGGPRHPLMLAYDTRLEALRS